MRGVYAARIKISGLNAAKTLLYLTAPSGKTVKILKTLISNASNETNEQCEAVWQRITTLGTPTGTALTPAKTENGDQAAGSTVVGNITASEPTYGTNNEIGYEGFATLAGYRFLPSQEEQPIIAGSESWGLRLLNAPTAFDAIVYVLFKEQG